MEVTVYRHPKPAAGHPALPKPLAWRTQDRRLPSSRHRRPRRKENGGRPVAASRPRNRGDNGSGAARPGPSEARSGRALSAPAALTCRTRGPAAVPAEPQQPRMDGQDEPGLNRAATAPPPPPPPHRMSPRPRIRVRRHFLPQREHRAPRRAAAAPQRHPRRRKGNTEVPHRAQRWRRAGARAGAGAGAGRGARRRLK